MRYAAERCRYGKLIEEKAQSPRIIRSVLCFLVFYGVIVFVGL